MNPGSRNDIPAFCIHEFVEEKVRLRPEFVNLVCNRNGVNRSWNWKWFAHEVDCFGKACMAYGAVPRSSVNIIGFNSPEWFIAFFGAICANYIAAGVYTTNAADACQYVAENSEAEIIVVEDKNQMKKYDSVIDKLKNVKAFVMWEEKPASGSDPRVIYWEDFLEIGRSWVVDEKLIERRSTMRPNQVCDLVYTSGTTGMPKGVMLTHDNLTYFM